VGLLAVSFLVGMVAAIVSASANKARRQAEQPPA